MTDRDLSSQRSPLITTQDLLVQSQVCVVYAIINRSFYDVEYVRTPKNNRSTQVPNNEWQHIESVRRSLKRWYQDFAVIIRAGRKVFGRQEAYTDQRCKSFIVIPSHENLFFVLQV